MLNNPDASWQNGTDESFNSKFRDECLSVELFRSRRKAVALIKTWRQRHNEVRPHGSLQYMAPMELQQQLRQDLQPAVLQELLS